MKLVDTLSYFSVIIFLMKAKKFTKIEFFYEILFGLAVSSVEEDRVYHPS